MANAHVTSALTERSSRLLRLSATRNMNVLLPRLPRCTNSLTYISGDISDVSHAKENGAFYVVIPSKSSASWIWSATHATLVNVQEWRSFWQLRDVRGTRWMQDAGGDTIGNAQQQLMTPLDACNAAFSIHGEAADSHT
jgi:hypothetical protein